MCKMKDEAMFRAGETGEIATLTAECERLAEVRNAAVAGSVDRNADDLSGLDANRCPGFEESSGEGGGVYECDGGPFIRRADAQGIMDEFKAEALKSAAPAKPEPAVQDVGVLIDALKKINTIVQVFLEGGYGKHYNTEKYIELAGLAQTWLKFPAAPVAQPLAGQDVRAVTELAVDEADFVLRVLANPGCKINDFAADGRWQKPESLGLVKCVGSWKWEPTGKLVELLRAALAAPSPVNPKQEQ